ncbi:hypothetical protein [Lysinibacillus sp. 54212]
MKGLELFTNFIMKQDTFIRIGFYVAAAIIILLAGYFIGGFIGRWIG